ncbi:MAG: hypothetical protein AAF990_22155 [Bacteroidota bacterium]
MTIKKLVLPLFIFLHCQIVFGQYDFEDIPLTNDVVEITQIASKKSLFKPKGKAVFKYEKGKLRSYKHYEGKKLIDEGKYEYSLVDGKEIVKEIKKNQKHFSFNVNYYDDQDRWYKSEKYLSNNVETPILISSDFRYNEGDKVVYCKVTSIQEGGQESVSEYATEYVDQHSWKKRTTFSFSEDMFLKTDLKYDPSSRSAIITRCMIYIIDEAEKKSKKLKAKIKDTLQKAHWVEEGTADINGKREDVYRTYTVLEHRLDDRGNWVEQYRVNKKGKKKLLQKRAIQYQ